MTATYLVVSDLDGTLLDHHNYSWQAARQALELLRERQIPLVLCSSKTAAEISEWRDALALTSPFIVENGAAVYVPLSGDPEAGFEVTAFGLNRMQVLGRLAHIRDAGDFHFTGFSDMSVADVVAVTGLDAASAANALQREFTEPLLWQDSQASQESFLRHLRKAGLTAVQGGRFLHVSAGCDKGRAMQWLRGWYAASTGNKPMVVALGDSDNDVTMLEAADMPVLVKSPVRDFPLLQHERVYRTTATGPAGWNEAILKLIA